MVGSTDGKARRGYRCLPARQTRSVIASPYEIYDVYGAQKSAVPVHGRSDRFISRTIKLPALGETSLLQFRLDAVTPGIIPRYRDILRTEGTYVCNRKILTSRASFPFLFSRSSVHDDENSRRKSTA